MAHGLDLVETEQAAAPAASAGGGSNWVTVGVTPATTQCQKPLPVGASGWKAGDCEHTGLFREARPMKLQRDVLDDRGLQWGSPLIQERNRDGRRRCLGGTTNVLLGGSNRTVALQPISLSGQTGLNLAIGVAALQLGLPRQ
jgi:hypothetical protein